MSEPRRLSVGQQALWYLYRTAPDSSAYNVIFAIRLISGVDPAALGRAMVALVRRHDLLRSTFTESAGEPVRLVGDADRARFEIRDVRSMSEQTLRAQVLSAAAEPLDLAGSGPFRAVLFHREEASSILLLVTHHIATDFVSQGVLMRDLLDLYCAEVHGSSAALPDLGSDYDTFVTAESSMLDSDRRAGLERYWVNACKGVPGAFNLPTDRIRPPYQTFSGTTHEVRLEPGLVDRVQAGARMAGVSPFIYLLTVFQSLLHRVGAQDDLVISCPTMPDMVGSLGNVAGYYVNPVAIRSRYDRRATFLEFLNSTRERFTEAMRHREYPFPMLVRLLDFPRDTSRSPLTQIAFSVQAADRSGELLDLHAQGDPSRELTYRGMRLASFPVPQQEGQFDLSLEVVQTSASTRAVFKYRTAVYDQPEIADLADQFVCLLAAAVEHADRPVAALDLLDGATQVDLLTLGRGQQAGSPERLASSLVTARAAEHPEAVAVKGTGIRLTYAALDRKANQVAQLLLAHGVSCGSRVGVCLPRNADVSAVMLGIMKIGATYLPLDPANPPQRLGSILAESQPPVVFGSAATLEALRGRAEVQIDLDAPGLLDGFAVAEPASPVNPGPAYAIYTSGSSGRPKGALLGHAGLVNLAEWQRDHFDLGPGRVVLQYASLGFDASVWELFMALGSGATLHVPDCAAPSGSDLARVVDEAGITHLTLPPSVLATLAPEDVPTLAHVISAGEDCPEDLARRWSVRCRLHNAYGPTEATVCATVSRHIADGRRPAIGRPIRNTRIYLVDEALRLVPRGAPGELAIGGVGVAEGYLNRPDLSAERFLPDPWWPGGRIYRTGDMARWRRDGELEFLGRRDSQVKVHGYRIELTEVEEILAQHAGVRYAVVTVQGQGASKRLVGHAVGWQSGASPASEELLDWMRDRLPAYLVPTTIYVVDALPLTTNGKVDRTALASAPSTVPAERVAPRNPTEEILVDILRQELGVSDVGVEDDFFAIGGHSLLAARLGHLLRERFGTELRLAQILRYPTVAGMARLLDTLVADGDLLPEIVPGPGPHEPFPLTDVQQAYLLGRREDFTLGGVSAHGYFEVEGPGLDAGRLTDSWNLVIERHGMLRVVFTEVAQRILPSVPRYTIRVHDFRHRSAPELASHIAEIREEMSHQVLAADRWPLFDIRLTLVPGERSRLHLSFDGLVADGVSLRRVLAEWAELYDDLDAELPRAAVSFRDYQMAARAVEDTWRFERSQRYWQERVAELPPGPELPVARGPLPGDIPRFDRMSARLHPETWQALRLCATREGVSLSNLVLAAYAEILARWSKRRHFTINVTLFNRLPLHRELDAVVGDFTSLSLLEVDLRHSSAVGDTVRAVQHRLWDDLDHRYYSGVRVQRDWARAHGRKTAGASMPIVFTSFVDSGADGWGFERFGEVVATTSQTPQVWLDHVVVEQGGGADLVWNVVPDMFPDGLLQDMFTTYVELLRELAEDATSWRREWRDLRPPVHVREHAEVNATEVTWDRIPLLHEPFFERVAQVPDATALIAPDRTLSYREVADKAERLAATLSTRCNSTGELVAVVMEKSWQQVVAVLGILRAGLAYLPVGSQLPAARRALLLREAGARIAVTRVADRHLLDLGGDPDAELPDGFVVCVVDEPGPAGQLATVARPPVSADDQAYVIHTSGSTGKPKGVMISHAAAMNTILDVNRRFRITGKDRVLALSGLNFDLSVYDIFGILAVGGVMVLPDHRSQTDPAHWLQLVERHGVTVWNSVPALMGLAQQWAALDQKVDLGSLRVVLLSGDWIPLNLPDQIRSRSPEAHVVSLGGATEASIWSISYLIDKLPEGWPSVPYGKPLANQTFEVLDEMLQPRPTWVPGELYIGGSGVAQGYLGDPIRTAEKFIVHPVSGARLYRTGDWGRYRPGGDLQFLGREDQQIKLHGNRIEIGEIEATLLRHGEVRSVLVAVSGQDNDRRLTAYVVGSPRDEGGEEQSLFVRDEVDSKRQPVLSPERVRNYLLRHLPQAMVPTAFVPLDALPLTANGKVDRSRLPKADADRSGTAPAQERSWTDVERLVAEIWSTTLERAVRGVEDNFFSLGGDSLSAVRVLSRIRDESGVRLEMRELFDAPTVAELARLVESRREDGAGSQQKPVPATGTNWVEETL